MWAFKNSYFTSHLMHIHNRFILMWKELIFWQSLLTCSYDILCTLQLPFFLPPSGHPHLTLCCAVFSERRISWWRRRVWIGCNSLLPGQRAWRQHGSSRKTSSFQISLAKLSSNMHHYNSWNLPCNQYGDLYLYNLHLESHVRNRVIAWVGAEWCSHLDDLL